MKKAILLLVAMMFIIWDMAYGQTINGCYNKNTGALRISSTCKKVEIPISWNAQGLKGDKGDKGDPGQSIQGLPGPPGGFFQVYDSLGQNLGSLINYGNYSTSKFFQNIITIFNPQSGKLFVINSANSSNLQREYDFFFENSSCVGTPLIRADFLDQTIAYDNWAVVHSGKFYSPINNTIFPLDTNAYTRINGDDRCLNAQFTITLPGVQVEEVDMGFSLPIYIPLSLEIPK